MYAIEIHQNGTVTGYLKDDKGNVKTFSSRGAALDHAAILTRENYPRIGYSVTVWEK